MSYPGTPIHHRALNDLISDNVVTPVNGGLRVPQNSPANALSILSATVHASSKKTDDPFTTEEAHDVVIDIFKELAALSEKSQKNSPTKNMSTQGRGLAPLSTIRSSEANKNAGDAQASPSKGSNKTSPTKLSGSDENLPPHLRSKTHHPGLKSKVSETDDDQTPPHLRFSKNKPGNSSTVNPETNYFSVLDPSNQAAFSGKLKEAGGKEDSGLRPAPERKVSKPTGLRSLSTSSSGSSSTPVPNDKKDKEGTNLDPIAEFGTHTAIATELNVDKEAAIPATTSSQAKSPEIKLTPKHLDKPKLQTTLPSWFVDKYTSKKPTTPLKTVSSTEEPTENLEHQTVFKAWPGQSERSRPGKVSISPFRSMMAGC